MVKDTYQQELDVRNYISSTENRNIFIEAGAGAGKSTSLVDRTYYSLAETVESKRIREEISSGKKTKQEIVNELSDFTGCTDKEIRSDVIALCQRVNIADIVFIILLAPLFFLKEKVEVILNNIFDIGILLVDGVLAY